MAVFEKDILKNKRKPKYCFYGITQASTEEFFAKVQFQ
jgi:hypothetical protein